MHVVMLTNSVAPDSLGGLERYVRELARELVATGTSVTVVAKRTGSTVPDLEIADDGVQVLRYSVPSKRDPSFALRYPLVVARAVARALDAAPRGDEPTVLHAHFPVPALVPAWRRLPYVYTLHAPVWRELLSERQGSYLLPPMVQQAAVSGLRRAETHVLGRAERVITLSEFMKREVAQLDAAAGTRTEVMAGGVDVDWFTPGVAPRNSWAEPAAPLLFTARRHVPRTGVQQLVQAMPAVLKTLPGARLAIAGSGPQTARIADEIDALDLQEKVRLVGRISGAELREWYRRADLVVTPTQELEGFGLATAEALACGSPCLVTPAGANPEVVAGLSPELVTPSCEPDGIAAAVARLAGRPGELAALRRRARDVVAPAMGWQQIARRHAELYAEVHAGVVGRGAARGAAA